MTHDGGTAPRVRATDGGSAAARSRLHAAREPDAPRARRFTARFALVVLALAAACADRATPPAGPPGEEAREPCADRNPLRNLYFGDLHVHTGYSFDAHVFEVRTTPVDAYRFARGEPLLLPPLGPDGRGTQELRLERPLDFAVVTDHSEFLGEVESCLVPGTRGYDTSSCAAFRAGGAVGQAVFGAQTTSPAPMRDHDVCGDDGAACRDASGEVWRRTIEAANDAYDRSTRCSFTALVGYEYTANTGASSQHRNVVFASDRVPPPTTYVEQPTPEGLWRELRAGCRADDGCDVLAIPHNPNQSNGRLLRVEYAPGSTLDEQRAQASARGAIEPLVEIFQHKGDSECLSGLSGVIGDVDEACGFEKLRAPPFEDCGDGVGSGGTGNGGCVSRRDYVRGALLEGLAEDARLGANPLPLGFVASTDTHNGTPGAVDERSFLGHRGNVDDLPDERLATEGARSGTLFNPGGITGVWAEENTRPALFAALARREVYGTSGPRIAVRLFGGWGLAPDLCDDPALLAAAYAGGVPMGGVLPPRADDGSAAAPRFVVSALRDPGTATHPGTPLERVQIVKGWVADGVAHERVHDVAGTAGVGGVDPATCALDGGGFDTLCTVWRDPDFDPAAHAFYYARVLETPSCRWNAWSCRDLTGGARPASCDDPAVPKTIQERAWTSPVFYRPPS